MAYTRTVAARLGLPGSLSGRGPVYAADTSAEALNRKALAGSAAPGSFDADNSADLLNREMLAVRVR